LACCWMMLCGPATESSTYVLLAPCLGWVLLAAWRHRWPAVPRLLVTLAGLLLLASVLAGLGPWVGFIHGLGTHPLATVLLLGGVLWMARRTLEEPDPI